MNTKTIDNERFRIIIEEYETYHTGVLKLRTAKIGDFLYKKSTVCYWDKQTGKRFYGLTGEVWDKSASFLYRLFDETTSNIPIGEFSSLNQMTRYFKNHLI